MIVDRVLLVCVGALGDLSWRKFISHAYNLERGDPNVELLLVDIGWSNSPGIELRYELRWRIGRRVIELWAEEIDSGKVPSLSLKYEIDSKTLPWEVEDFFENYVEGPTTTKALEKERLHAFVDKWVSYFMIPSVVTGLPRYCSDLNQVGSVIKRLRDGQWRVVLYIATPPQAYPRIINRWKYIVDRIVLEKPACGLNPCTLLFDGPNELMEALADIPANVQVVTTDHYNAKSMVRLMDRINDYGIFKDLLSPGRIKRIVVQLLEAAPLPLGRCSFYVGAGGAFGDMVPHLLQAVRAALGLMSTQLNIRFGEHFCWGRYDSAPIPTLFTPPEDVIPYTYEPGYYQPLSPETETFVAFDAEVLVSGHSIPLYCRTGKGFHADRKTLRIDTDYDGQGSELSLLFNFADNSLIVRDQSKGFVLAFGGLSLHDPFDSGIPSMAWEYRGIFEALIRSEWKPDALNERYFPSVANAADASSAIFQRLLEERHKSSRILHSYSVKRPSTREGILSFLEAKAHWG